LIEDSILHTHKQLVRQIEILQMELRKINKKVSTFEAWNEQWGVRYSKRVALLANLGLGIWFSAYKLFRFLNKRKRTLITQVVVPLKTDIFNAVISGALVHALQQSWALLLASALIYSQGRLKSVLGSIISFTWSLYLAYAGKSPWIVWFTLFSDLLYLTAELGVSIRKKLPDTVLEFMHRSESTNDLCLENA